MRKLFILLSLLITSFGFSQKKTLLTFNIKGSIFAPKLNSEINTNKVSTISAKIDIPSGKFKITLIDFNQNNIFNDYRGCCRDIGSDGIIMSAYNEKIINTFTRRFILKKYPISINGNTFILNNIRKNEQGVYIADLINKKIELGSVFKTRNKVLIDSIPNIKLLNLITNKEVRLIDLIKPKRKLYMNVMNWSECLFYMDNKNLRYSLKKYFFNSDLVNIVVVKKHSLKYALRVLKKQPYRFLLIDTSDKKKLTLLGYNMSSRSTYLFNEKGKVILTDAFNYLNMKKIENKKKLKLLMDKLAG